mmetsp:Transcript_15133/g.45343  ORF Transcript_15133/g.45343 Transcript_15133/m.45343 type:complete len:230 (+) Transcript_15133:856-1545(+)
MATDRYAKPLPGRPVAEEDTRLRLEQQLRTIAQQIDDLVSDDERKQPPVQPGATLAEELAKLADHHLYQLKLLDQSQLIELELPVVRFLRLALPNKVVRRMERGRSICTHAQGDPLTGQIRATIFTGMSHDTAKLQLRYRVSFGDTADEVRQNLRLVPLAGMDCGLVLLHCASLGMVELLEDWKYAFANVKSLHSQRHERTLQQRLSAKLRHTRCNARPGVSFAEMIPF